MSKIAVLFPGQGSQYNKMGLDFYEESDEYKNTMDKVFEVQPELKQIIYGEDNKLLNETLYAQLAIASMEIGIYDIIKDKIDINATAGFSLGEYSSLYASGLFHKNDIFDIIKLRATLMNDTKVDGAMIALLRTDYETVSELINNYENGDIYIANYNTKEQIVVSCANDIIDDAVEYFKSNGIKKAVKLKVSGPFHSKYYQQTAKEFKKELEKFDIGVLDKEIYLNTSAQKYDSATNLLESCQEQMYTQVNWYPLINNMINDGYDTFLEVGPGSVLKGFMKKIDKSINVVNIEKFEDLEKVENL